MALTSLDGTPADVIAFTSKPKFTVFLTCHGI